MDPRREEARESWLDGALRLVATALPFGLAMMRAASSTQWRDDLGSVRDLGLVAVGFGGGVSTIAAQLASIVPLGSRTFRAACVSTLALALAARLLYDLTLRALRTTRPSLRLAPLLAGIATLTAALSPTWQREATIGGSAMLGVALALAAFTIAERFARVGMPDSKTALALGAVFGACFVESPAAGAAAALASMASAFARTGFRGLPVSFDRRALNAFAFAAITVVALLSAPLVLRPLAPRAWMDVGRALSSTSLAGFDVASARTTALAAWTREIGVVSLAIAAFGAVTAAMKKPLRPVLAAAAAFVVLDTLLPARATGVLSTDPLTSLRSLALAAIALTSAIGVHEAVTRLLDSRVPLSKSASVLVVVFHLTLVALTSEEAGFAADRSEQLAAETWTDEAFGQLPPRAAVLARTPALAWRLWSARLLRGERPDVLVMPIPLLDRGNVATATLAREPRADALLRDFALTGDPSEFALSKLADVRPLEVELDRGWSRRLASHLMTGGEWLEYETQPVAISDRKLAAATSNASMRRVTQALLAAAVPDVPTSTILATSLRAQSTVLGLLGDEEGANAMLAKLETVAQDPTVSTVPTRYAIAGIRRLVAKKLNPPQRQR